MSREGNRVNIDDGRAHPPTPARWRRLGVAVAAMIVLAVAPACEPLPTPPTFTVTTTHDAPDAQPGDDVCEATPGEGDCTLRAAVDEANAAGRATIVVPFLGQDEDLWIEAPLEIAPGTNVHLLGQRDAPGSSALPTYIAGEHMSEAIHVRQGASLLVSDLSTMGISFSVEGNLVARRAHLHHYYDAPAVRIHSSGNAILWHSFIVGSVEPGVIENHGSLATRYALVTGLGVPAVHTGTGATTTFTATLFDRQAPEGGTDLTGAICTGEAVSSGGYNHAINATCGLDHPTDVEDGDPLDSGSGVYTWVDRIPPGEVGCGDLDDFDIDGRPRPSPYIAGDEPACDIGPWEHAG